MHATLVHVHVKPKHIEQFIAATKANHEASIKEPANLRLDVLQSPEDPGRFILYEVNTTVAAAAAHKEMPHYQKRRNAVAPWMTSPRQGIRYNGLFPANSEQW